MAEDAIKRDPSGHTPLRLSDFDEYRRTFGTKESRDGYFQHYYVLDGKFEDEVLTPLIGVDKVAEELLIGSALKHAHRHWKKWKSKAQATGAFSYADLIGEVARIATEAMEDFDPSKSKSFTKHAIGRIDLRVSSWAGPEIYAAEHGRRLAPSMWHKVADPEHRGLGKDMIEEIKLPAPERVSLQSHVSLSDENSMELSEMIASDIGDPDEDFINIEDRLEAKEMVAQFDLSWDEWSLLDLFLGLQGQMPMSLRACAEELNYGSHNTVKSQIEKVAVKMGTTYETLATHQEAEIKKRMREGV